MNFMMKDFDCRVLSTHIKCWLRITDSSLSREMLDRPTIKESYETHVMLFVTAHRCFRGDHAQRHQISWGVV